MRNKLLFGLLLLLGITFIAGCLGNQSTMDIGHVDRVEDTPRAMPEPTPVLNTTTQAPTQDNNSISESEAQQIQTLVVQMIPVVLVIAVLGSVLSSFGRRGI